MSKLIIHIGSPKTGTTAIQDILSLHSNVLKDRFEYPEIGRNKGGGQVGFRRSLLKNIGESDIEIRESYKDFFDKCLKSGKNIVISSEQLWTVNPSRILEVYPNLEGFEICVIAYLREQASMINSHFKQKIKAGLSIKNLDAFFESFKHHYNYYDVLKKWESAFRSTKILALVYEYEKESLVSNFFHNLDSLIGGATKEVESDISVIKNKKSNQSFDEFLLLIFSVINSSGYEEELKSNMRRFLMRNIKYPLNKENFSYSFLSEALEEKIKQHYIDSNVDLKNTFIKGRYENLPITIW